MISTAARIFIVVSRWFHRIFAVRKNPLIETSRLIPTSTSSFARLRVDSKYLNFANFLILFLIKIKHFINVKYRWKCFLICFYPSLIFPAVVDIFFSIFCIFSKEAPSLSYSRSVILWYYRTNLNACKRYP